MGVFAKKGCVRTPSSPDRRTQILEELRKRSGTNDANAHTIAKAVGCAVVRSVEKLLVRWFREGRIERRVRYGKLRQESKEAPITSYQIPDKDRGVPEIRLKRPPGEVAAWVWECLISRRGEWLGVGEIIRIITSAHDDGNPLVQSSVGNTLRVWTAAGHIQRVPEVVGQRTYYKYRLAAAQPGESASPSRPVVRRET